jgi:hypothetical protein
VVEEQPENDDSIEDQLVALITPRALPAPPEESSNPTRRLLDRAGLRSGHRILDLGARLYDHEMSQSELEEFHVLGLREDASVTVGRQLRSVCDGAASVRCTVNSIDDLDLPDASFDAVVALDWWPATTLPVVVRRWRHLLAPGVGAVILAGTDIPAMHNSHHQASQLWIDELTSAGFTVEIATNTPTEPRHYAALAVNARSVSDPLRAVLGDGPARSYLAHVELLSQATQEGPTHRFEIIASL